MAHSFQIVGGEELTDTLCQELADVFSSSYGRWSADVPPPRIPGGPIRMKSEIYRRWYAKKEYRFALCRDEAARLIGQAVYIEEETSRGKVAFVVQLVVEPAYRHQGIATSLLHSIWGFSDYYAWGIVTSSPCTIEALEGATFRRGTPARIAQDAQFLKDELFSKIEFLKTAEWTVSDSVSYIDTRFFTDRTNIVPGRSNVPARYGALPSGQEWLAVIFNDQPPTQLESFAGVIERSSQIVADAYRRMPQASQPWAQKTDEEIDAILSMMPRLASDSMICDFGAGTGRHLHALRNRGFTNVKGIDFALSECGRARGVEEADCRTYRTNVPCELIMCLYDVIGSFPKEEDNRRIVANIAANLSETGRVALSVANSAYASKAHIVELENPTPVELLEAVFKLRPSNAMRSDGEFFESESVWDKSTGLFYHKEQFSGGAFGLDAEYLVVDRRYARAEIEALLADAGLEVCASRFVRAGFDRDFESSGGKEILLIALKRKQA